MTLIRALTNRSNSLGSDRREATILQELRPYCPSLAMGLGETSRSFNLGLVGLSEFIGQSWQW